MEGESPTLRKSLTPLLICLKRVSRVKHSESERIYAVNSWWRTFWYVDKKISSFLYLQESKTEFKCRKLPFSHSICNINWLPVFLPSLVKLITKVVKFWLILNQQFAQLVSNSLNFDSYTTNTLSSLGYFKPGDNGQINSSKSLSDLSSINSILHWSHNLDLVDLHYKIQNTCYLYAVSMNKKILSIDHDIREKIIYIIIFIISTIYNFLICKCTIKKSTIFIINNIFYFVC